MSESNPYAGIDVAKTHLDVAIDERAPACYDNNEQEKLLRLQCDTASERLRSTLA